MIGLASSVGERKPVGGVRVAGDAEQAAVVQAVVPRAERDQVVAGRRSSVFPVDDVVDLDPAPRAAGHPAASIPIFHHPAQHRRHDVATSPDIDWATATQPDHRALRVTQELAAHGFGEGRAVVQVPGRAIHGDVEQDLEGLATRWRPHRGQ